MRALDSAQQDTAESRPGRWWVRTVREALVAAVLVTVVGCLATVALVAVIVGAAPRAELSWAVVLSAVPGWLAAFRVPLRIDGAPLSALPLLPTLLLVVAIAWSAARVARRCRLRRPGQLLPLVLTTGGFHTLTGLSCVATLELLQAPVRAGFTQAWLHCAPLSCAAALAGAVDRCGVLYLLWQRLPRGMWPAVRVGASCCACVVTAGAAVLLTALALNLPEVQARSVALGSVGAGWGATVLAVLYVPNAVFGAWTFATGTGLALGDTVLTPFSGALERPLPVLPLFGLLPEEPPATPVLAVLSAPLLAGVVVGVCCRRAVARDGSRVLLYAGLCAGLFVLVATLVSGGGLGGVYGPLSLRPVVAALATTGWLTAVAVPVARLVGDTGDGDELAESPPAPSDGDTGEEPPERSEPSGESAEDGQEPDGRTAHGEEAPSDVGWDDAAAGESTSEESAPECASPPLSEEDGAPAVEADSPSEEEADRQRLPLPE
ncbi:cell division protein PerM [Actinopolyspora mortivallis]|uniref:Uncharacterized protein n=1 Tax=Actinopolyspora mortivallis TaxID=33906 RepID=A0A2T0GS26_ACTMO|nr:DUF6350 family protein [Actinopolyspora mortivallis]PRW61843.1 hypothetical protein CEP50_18580 [Actinopolyspora mortivallis]